MNDISVIRVLPADVTLVFPADVTRVSVPVSLRDKLPIAGIVLVSVLGVIFRLSVVILFLCVQSGKKWNLCRTYQTPIAHALVL